MSDLLNQVTHAHLYVAPIQLFLTISLNIITIRILSSYILRKSSCSYYLLVYAVIAILYMGEVCPGQFLSIFKKESSNNDISCKILSFTGNLTPILSRWMLVLASFDRFCSSSHSTSLRSQSTTKKAKRNIIIATVVVTITMLPAFFTFYWDKTVLRCQSYSSSIAVFFLFIQMICFTVLTPLIMLILGCLMIYNIKQSANRVQSRSINRTNRRTEGQLARMLIIQIIFLVITTIPYAAVLSLVSIRPSIQTPFVSAIHSITLIIVQTQFYTTFFLYIVSGQIYRQEFLRIFFKIRRNNLVQPLAVNNPT